MARTLSRSDIDLLKALPLYRTAPISECIEHRWLHPLLDLGLALWRVNRLADWDLCSVGWIPDEGRPFLEFPGMEGISRRVQGILDEAGVEIVMEVPF